MPIHDFAAELEALRATLSEAVSRSGQRLTEAANRIAVAVLATDDSGRYISANDAACRLTGYRRDELLTKSVADLTPPSGEPVHDRLWNAFSRTGEQRGSYDLLRKDNTIVDVVYHAFWDVAAGVHVSFLEPNPKAG